MWPENSVAGFFFILTSRRREQRHTQWFYEGLGLKTTKEYSCSDDSRAIFTHREHVLSGQMFTEDRLASSWMQSHDSETCQKCTIQEHCKANNTDCAELCLLVLHQITRVFLPVTVNQENLQLDFTQKLEFISQYLCTSFSTIWRGKFLGDKPQNQNCILFDSFHLELNSYFTLILLFLPHSQNEVP